MYINGREVNIVIMNRQVLKQYDLCKPIEDVHRLQSFSDVDKIQENEVRSSAGSELSAAIGIRDDAVIRLVSVDGMLCASNCTHDVTPFVVGASSGSLMIIPVSKMLMLREWLIIYM